MNGRDVRLRLRALIFRSRTERELDEELNCHIDLQTRKHLAAAMPIEEARKRARLDFGGVALAKEECRDARGVSILETTVQDIVFAARILRKSPGFTIAAACALQSILNAFYRQRWLPFNRSIQVWHL